MTDQTCQDSSDTRQTPPPDGSTDAEGPLLTTEASARFAATPAPPYYAVIFSNQRTVQDAEGYAAMDRMARALREFSVGPLKTTLPLHRRLMENSGFRTGGVDIHYLERLLKA